MLVDTISNVQKAYGLLWLSPDKDAKATEARKFLGEVLTSDERIAGVKWASEPRDQATERTDHDR